MAEKPGINLAILMGSKKPMGKASSSDSADAAPESSKEAMVSKKSIAQELLAAIADKDAQAVADALESFMEECGEGEE